MRSALHLKKGDVVDFAGRASSFRLDIPDFVHRCWHVVMVDPCTDRSVAKRLEEDLGLLPYVPQEWRSVPGGRGRKREVQVPMLPGYVLVGLPDLDWTWRAVLATRGVEGFLHRSGSQTPATLSDASVERLRYAERCANNKREKRLAAAGKSEWQPGGDVWVDLVPGFSPLLAKIGATKDPRGRIEILLEEDVFGRRAWSVEPKQLRRVSV
ncbi:transcription termination/antitermination NusG family protein [Rhodopseudomonas sp. BR0G17]|uniref:transcription termination/antitermination NusG family protein n=1 Tax=Rhodopseudomonas sp. BR0G17 TaxID=2269368 RepID=UPI0013DFCE99|nr:transcription termination/antitermination NusG family protein [Rhodopseudomonas sp. BR0G17]NEW95513.1 hypothetical protein [Rhodopseudomonas sp. BR0G17]